MNNEPYGWVKNGEYVLYIEKPDSVFNYIPLYTHPHPDNLGLAESIIKQQELQIEALKEELKKSAEVNRLLAEDIGYEE